MLDNDDTEFRVGDTIICTQPVFEDSLTEGAIYTIRKIIEKECFCLEEVKGVFGYYHFIPAFKEEILLFSK